MTEIIVLAKHNMPWGLTLIVEPTYKGYDEILTDGENQYRLKGFVRGGRADLMSLSVEPI